MERYGGLGELFVRTRHRRVVALQSLISNYLLAKTDTKLTFLGYTLYSYHFVYLVWTFLLS